MADDNKNIPPSAGEAAKVIVDEDKAMNENAQQVSEAKPVSYAAPAQAKSNGGATGWKVASIVFAIIALGAGVACFYFATTKGGDASDSTGTKCAETIQNVEQTEKGETGDIATSAEGDYVVNFYKSGLKLNLGSGFEFINLSYSASPSSGQNYVERVAIGGLSKNTTGAQDIPAFARGEIEAYNSGDNTWTPLAILTIYDRAYWDANIQPGIDEAEANGVATSESKWYKDEKYAVSYSHPQGVVSPEGWQRDWELASVEALQAAIENTDNWSK